MRKIYKKNILKIVLICFMAVVIITVSSCGQRYEKITPAWKSRNFKAQNLSIIFNQDSIEIPKQREGLSNINGVGKVLESLFAEVAHIQLKETGEIAIPVISKDMPSLERFDFDSLSIMKLNSLELKIKDEDLSDLNNFNFIKRVRLLLSFEKIIKIDEVEVVPACEVFLLDRKPIFTEIPALTYINGELYSWSSSESKINIADLPEDTKKEKLTELDFNNKKNTVEGYLCQEIEKQGGRVIKKKHLKKYEVLRYDEKFAQTKGHKKITILDDSSNIMMKREIILDPSIHDVFYKNGQYLKQTLKFKINNLDWKKILKTNNRFNIHLFISADNLPPLSFSKVDLSLKVQILPKI